MFKSTLLLGSNLGKRELYLQKAWEAIEAKAGVILRRSLLYETGAWGKEDQPAFLNQAGIIETKLEPEVLLDTLLAIETQLGRHRQERWQARSIDIDILYYEDQIIQREKLQVPHPRIAERRFALVPLVEICSNFEHPQLKKTHRELLEICSDHLAVNIYASD